MDSTSAVASFVEQYIDVNESVAQELQSRVSDYLNMDMEHRTSVDKAFAHARDLSNRTGSATPMMDTTTRKRILRQLTMLLMRMQEMGDERLRLVEGAQDMIDAKRRCIDASRRRLDAGACEEPSLKLVSSKEEEESRDTTENSSEVGLVATSRKSNAVRKKDRSIKPGPSGVSSSGGKRSVVTPSNRQNRVLHNPSTNRRRAPGSNSKSRRKPEAQSKPEASDTARKADNDNSDPDSPGPLYCVCQQVSFGEMIACDNESCSIEWFHFLCVNVHSRPKGKWFCPKCRGDSARLKRPDA